MIVEFYKTRGDVLTPDRANPSDAGLDVYFCPEDSSLTGQWLDPGESGLFQTGLKFGVPHGYMLEVKNRSGNAAKRHLLVGACVIDSGYNGEVFVNLHNVGRDRQFIEKNMKIAQVVMTPIVPFRLQACPEALLYAEPITISDRGDGALGSTDG